MMDLFINAFNERNVTGKFPASLAILILITCLGGISCVQAQNPLFPKQTLIEYYFINKKSK
jgi:hypothetical protein